MLNNVKKCFSGIRVNQNKKIFEWLIVFSNCYFRLCENWYLQNFCLIKNWMMLEIVDKSVYKIMTLSNNLVFICRFQGHNLVFCSLHMIREICFLLNHDLWKLQLDSSNTKHKSLNRTLPTFIFINNFFCFFSYYQILSQNLQ